MGVKRSLQNTEPGLSRQLLGSGLQFRALREERFQQTQSTRRSGSVGAEPTGLTLIRGLMTPTLALELKTLLKLLSLLTSSSW